MRGKGFTLIEVILSITLIGLIAITFLPAITFSYTNIIESAKFTDDTFKAQQDLEILMESKRKDDIDNPQIEPKVTSTFEIFGIDIKGHVIKQEIINPSGNKHGELNIFLPKPKVSYIIPEIESPPIIVVRNNNYNMTPQPNSIDILDTAKNLFVNEIDITDETQDEFLMNVYRWYYYDGLDDDNPKPNNDGDYLIIKEWNEARKIISYEESEQFSFIPNIKDNYNILAFNEFNMTNEELIEKFGGKYIRYSVTPYSIIGKIGEEEFSNQIYVEAPKLNIIDTAFLVNLNDDLSEQSTNKIMITFDIEINSDSFDITKMNFNEALGDIGNVYSPTDDTKTLIVEFTNPIDTTQIYDNNTLDKGAVSSTLYGKIQINNGVDNKFNINKKYVLLDSNSKYNIKTDLVDRYIDVRYNGTSNNSEIIIYSLDNDSSQKWYIKSIGDSPYSHIIASHDLNRSLKNNGLNNNIVRDTTYNNSSTNIQWKIEKQGSKFIFRSRDDINHTINILGTINNTRLKLTDSIGYWQLYLNN